jgi:hypothetical protein
VRVRACVRAFSLCFDNRSFRVVRIGSCASKRNETKRSDSLAITSIDLVKKKKDDADENVRNVASVRAKRGEARMWGGGVDGWW